MSGKIDVFIFALAIATVTAMPSTQDDKNETSVKSDISKSVSDPIPLSIAHPCRPNACGANAVCTEKNGVGSCVCLPEYIIGNPYEGCRPECVLNTDCPSHSSCIRNRCKDPCPGVCGRNAECQVINHIPTCLCSTNYTGNAFSSCTPIEDACLNNTECSAGLACMRQKCVDPCIGTCGENAACEVLNHTPICSCSEGRIGNPFVKCKTSRKEEALRPRYHPCSRSPCGPNSECRSMNGHVICSCLPTYFGSPPRCRDGCVLNSDCSSNSACIDQKCVDPCHGSCGHNATCNVLNHTPICSCPSGMSGDPFVACNIDDMPCLNETECSAGLACVNKKCVDPCIGACGENSACKVSNRTPICKCPDGRIGDPFVKCTTAVEEEALTLARNPCSPSPCGPNSECRSMNGQAVCSCRPTYLGTPPSCRPECLLNSDCDAKFACIDQQCKDPCSEGLCGRNAECRVVKHIADCLCPPAPLDDPNGPCHYVTAESNTPEDKSEKTSLQ